MWKELKISDKGQVTLPKDMRDALGLKPGDAVVFTVDGDEIVITAKSVDFNELAGFLGAPPGGAATLDEIDATVTREAGRNAVPEHLEEKDDAA